MFLEQELTKVLFQNSLPIFQKLFQGNWYFKIKMNHMKINYKLKTGKFLLALSDSLYSNIVHVVKSPPANAGNVKDVGSNLRSGRWRYRAWQPTPVFLPGESHGQRSVESQRVRNNQSKLTLRHASSI